MVLEELEHPASPVAACVADGRTSPPIARRLSYHRPEHALRWSSPNCARDDLPRFLVTEQVRKFFPYDRSERPTLAAIPDSSEKLAAQHALDASCRPCPMPPTA